VKRNLRNVREIPLQDVTCLALEVMTAINRHNEFSKVGMAITKHNVATDRLTALSRDLL